MISAPELWTAFEDSECGHRYKAATNKNVLMMENKTDWFKQKTALAQIIMTKLCEIHTRSQQKI